jgi:phage shock protein PspC (stress-responsive transcriptional regulator)
MVGSGTGGGTMGLKERALAGVLGGAAATFVLSVLREVLTRIGLVFETAPQQVVERMEEVGLVEGWSPRALRVLTVAAHFAYGMGTGTAFGFLRRERGGASEEAAVGAALGLLAWGVGWASWLPLAGVHRAPWTQRTPKVLLPVLDHAVFGAAWGLAFWVIGGRARRD